MTPDDEAEAEVLEVNDRFYRAFESLDLAEMESVWAKEPHVRCVHPGWSLLSGWEAVRGSWEAIFRNTVEIRFTIRDVQVHIEGMVAWLTCTEDILSETRGNIGVTSALATNIFERRGGRWLMIHHHSSHVFEARAESDPPGAF
ncbi:MAG TPA: nuclear transport factor 2 family protein [Methylomirabilota bacterium]|nr:nuclear transport factor 2 family protein [Methylomirabilota bacterium]